jgi:hypothetical protein
VRRLLSLFCLLAGAVLSHGQPGASSPAALSPAALSSAQAQALVARALSTELRTAQDPNHLMRYLLRRTSPRLTSTKAIVETRDGAVARLLSIDDRPLGQADEQKEQARLDALAGNPSLQRHRKQSEDEDMGIVLKLLRMLPDAFFYEYAGSGAGPAGKVEKFSFRPNPHFSPPDYETQALTALSGEIWIDAAQERVTRLEGHLQQDTDYGWGILGKLNKGGWVVIEQADQGGGQWRIVHVQMRMTMRILFKTKIFDTNELMTRYAPVPAGMDYRSGILMLKKGS